MAKCDLSLRWRERLLRQFDGELLSGVVGTRSGFGGEIEDEALENQKFVCRAGA